MKIGRWMAAVGIAAAAAAGPVAAQEKGIYLGGSFGIAQYQESCESLTVRCDDKDSAWRVFAGYQFNRWVAIEAAWADMGSIKFEGDPAGTFNQETDVYGADLVAVLSWPILDNLSLFGKAGGYRMRVASDIMTAGVPSSRGETSGGLTYGLGAEFRIGGRLGIRAEFQRYDNVGGDRAGIDNVIFYSAGLLYRF